MLNSEDIRHCRVCGFREDPPPWGEDGLSATFNLCTRCGVEFGYEDASLNGIRRYREEWIKHETPWFRPECKPEGWRLEEQLTSIPEGFV